MSLITKKEIKMNQKEYSQNIYALSEDLIYEILDRFESNQNVDKTLTYVFSKIFYIHSIRLYLSSRCRIDLFDDIYCLVPIPLHPRRLRQRGFNQAEYICREMSEVLRIPIDTEHLMRTRNNPHQSRSRFDDRQRNVQDLFAIRYPEEWKNRHILLVDDVITSGATMFECMRQTSPIRGCRVSAFALGWAHN